ncbi:uncharacterized protein [Halyomorpha halys]|nr:uncharacterized protein LOC106685452 isoform X2 [Halyomorpha halys]
MFDSGNPIKQMELNDFETMCLLCEKNSEQKYLTVLKLPTKVTQTYLGSNEIQLNSDLKIMSGLFLPSPLCRITAIYGEKRLLATNDVGLMIYNIKVSDTDQIGYNTTLNFPLYYPYIALINKSTAILTKDTRKKSLIADLSNGEILRDFVLDENVCNDLIPVCLNENLIALTEKTNGTTHLHDWRSNEKREKIHAGDEGDAALFPASRYSYIQNSNPSNNICFLSQSGVFKTYDLRDSSKPLMKHNLNLSTTDDNLKVKFDPNNNNIVSISGFDSNIYIFDISQNMKEIFKHDGHSRTEDCKKYTSVTDHLWYPTQFIMSGALNNSLNCWIPDTSER